MSLVIRFVQEGEVGMLRSVGDPPNGVITVIHPDEDGAASWAVDPNYEPPPLREPEGLQTVIDAMPGGAGENATAVSVEDLAAALVDQESVTVLWNLLIAGVRASADRFAPRGHFEQVAQDALFGVKTREALIAAGWFERQETV